MWLLRVFGLALALAVFGAGSAWAQDDPPGRVGRLADMRGPVFWFDQEEGQWSEAQRNRPLTSGDRVSTAADGRAELRIGSTVLRLGSTTELEVLALDDQRMSFQLHSGSLALRVRSREVAEEIELVTEEARLRPLRSGHYRLDRIDDTSHAGSWRGSLRIEDTDGFIVDSGQWVELWRERRSQELRHAWGSPPQDGFAEWVVREEQRDERSAATRHVSPEMTGAEDLDRYGRWERHPEYGVLWFPLEVQLGWVPYRDGRWVWVRPWGWTWVDEAPWGFAPFHYGRWVHWGGRWGWSPGTYVARPVYAPALVAWVGGAHWGVSINIGGPAIGWVPLAPREVFVPWYRTTPVYVDRINRRPPPRPGHKPVPQVPTGPVMYGNQGVPGAVTVVPRDVLVQRQPVSRAVVEPRGAVAPGQPLVGVSPPPAPVPRAEGRPPTLRPPPPPAGRVTPRPEDRREPGPVIDLRRERPAPAEAPVQRDNRMPERSPQTGGPAPRPHAAPPFAAPAAPAAPVAPVAPPTVAPPAAPRAVVPPAASPVPAPAPAPAAAPAAVGPAAPVRTGPPQARPAPVPRPAESELQREREREREREDERKRVPESRHGPRVNQQ